MSIEQEIISNLREHGFEEEWHRAVDEMPVGEFEFLTPEFLRRYSGVVGLSEEAVETVEETARFVERSSELRRYTWFCHRLIDTADSDSRHRLGELPILDSIGQRHSLALYLIVALSGLPRAMAFHKSRSIPDQIALDTYSDTRIWAEDCHDKTGIWGINPRILPWLANHLCGDLYRLVRLQFVQRPFRYHLLALRHRVTRHVIVFSSGGTVFRSDGQVDGTSEIHDPTGRWTAELKLEGTEIEGYPIHPRGYAVKERHRLSLLDWEIQLLPGDPILEIHIPAGEPMAFDACGESFKTALEFFPRYFPDRPFVGFCCGSWLLNTQYEELLSGESNIVRFMRELYLFPIRSGGMSGFDRIFGRQYDDLTQAPRDTSLRRAVLDHLMSGKRLRAGGALFFGEDLDWGQQVYRSGLRSYLGMQQS